METNDKYYAKFSKYYGWCVWERNKVKPTLKNLGCIHSANRKAEELNYCARIRIAREKSGIV